MATLCVSFSTAESARRGAEALSSGGVPARDIGSLTPQDGDEHERVADDAMARELLSQAQVPGDVTERMVQELHEGRAVVLATIPDIHTAETLIAQMTVAA